MKILFFAPHAAVWIHSFPEALVAEALLQHGHEIFYVGCRGLLNSHCVAMSGHGVPFEADRTEKERICRMCRSYEDVIRRRFGFAGPDLADLADGEDRRIASELLDSVPPSDYLNLVVEQVEVGRLALYEILIQVKKSELDFDTAELQRYRANIWNAIVVLRVAQRLFDTVHPDRVVVYNALYSVNRVVCRLAEIRGIPQYYLHAGDSLARRLETLVLAKNHAFSYYEYLREAIWPQVRDRPCPLNAMRLATDHLLEAARGRSVWAYSAAPKRGVDIRKAFGIGAGRRLICATMSSDDERLGGEMVGVLPSLHGVLFPTQVDWIRALIEFVGSRTDLFLVVRVHPREFPNKREGVLSAHAKTLMETFTALPKNVKVNWPADEISLYDLANVTDVFANGWSSAGKEAAWLGLPVVLYSSEFALYPTELNYVGTTLSAYRSCIEQALQDGWNPERIRKTYRWCAVEYAYSPLDISDSFSRSEHASFLEKCVRRGLRYVAPTFEQEKDCRARARSLASSDRIERILREELSSGVEVDNLGRAVPYAEETISLKREIRRVVDALYGGGERSPDASLASKLRKYAAS